jgi:hypothetical protein
LSDAAKQVPVCEKENDGCIDDWQNLKEHKIFLNRGECRTYTGSAVNNTANVYEELGATNVQYFDSCKPDGSHYANDTNLMCLEHVFGPLKPNPKPIEYPSQMFDQRPFLTNKNVGFADEGLVYIPQSCKSGEIKCGLKVVFHGCGGYSDPDQDMKNFAEANDVILLHPNVPG